MNLIKNLLTRKYRIIHDEAFSIGRKYYADRYFVEVRRFGIWMRVEEDRQPWAPPGWPTLKQAQRMIAEMKKTEVSKIVIYEVE